MQEIYLQACENKYLLHEPNLFYLRHILLCTFHAAKLGSSGIVSIAGRKGFIQVI